MRIIVLLLLALAGCETVDRIGISEFTPLGGDRFQYRAHEAIVYSHEDRMSWLGQYLADNQMCPNGYEIEDQRHLDNGNLVNELFIIGRCNSG